MGLALANVRRDKTMRVKLRFIPGLIASYFGLDEVSSLELPENAKYEDLMKALEKRFEEASNGSGHGEGRSLPDSFVILSNGEPITSKLNRPVNPGEEISVVVMVSGG